MNAEEGELRPQLLDVLCTRNETTQRPFTEFGGTSSGASFVPSAETACFLLAGDALGPRLAAAFNHAFMLVFHPRDSKGEHLQALLDAGWSTDGVVTISQLVTFLAYQIRLVHGLRAMQSGGAANG